MIIILFLCLFLESVNKKNIEDSFTVGLVLMILYFIQILLNALCVLLFIIKFSFFPEKE